MGAEILAHTGSRSPARAARSDRLAIPNTLSRPLLQSTYKMYYTVVATIYSAFVLSS
jgi:hypothetical protein